MNTTVPLPRLAGISSKATAALLAELARDWEAAGGAHVAMESVGGVDAARRVEAGESFDVVVLDSAQQDRLVAAGRLLGDTRRAIVRSQVVAAVRAGAARPSIGTTEELRRCLLSARAVGYSTGPSGVALLALVERLGLRERLRERLVQAPAGTPVGAMIARGEVDVGFQQRSELAGLTGVDVLGPLPPGDAITSTFVACVCAASARAGAARRFVDYLASREVDDAKRRHGFEPA